MRPTYQERVIEEKSELDKKIESLTSFLKSESATKIDHNEVDRMQRQLDCMVAYSEILGERIVAFGDIVPDDEDKDLDNNKDEEE